MADADEATPSVSFGTPAAFAFVGIGMGSFCFGAGAGSNAFYRSNAFKELKEKFPEAATAEAEALAVSGTCTSHPHPLCTQAPACPAPLSTPQPLLAHAWILARAHLPLTRARSVAARPAHSWAARRSRG